MNLFEFEKQTNKFHHEGARQRLSEHDTKQFVHRYLPWLQKELKIKELPKIELLDEPITTSFGQYSPDDKSIKLVVGGRHPVDVLRTMAHELTHYKQDLAGELTPGAGETGTPQENEANSNAGVVMRNFAHANPEYFGLESSSLDEDAITEIVSMPASGFRGGRRSIEDRVDPKTLKPLPGGSGLAYSIQTEILQSRNRSIRFNYVLILIVDPEKSKTQPIAFLKLEEDNSLPIRGKPLKVELITVDEAYRGQGLAKAMYGIVLTILKRPLVSGEAQTPGGKRNWLSLSSIPGVEVKGVINVSNAYLEGSTKLADKIMQLGGQFISKNQYVSYWAFDVVPGDGQLAPAVKNTLSKIYGYDSDVKLVATWHG
jgi:hypothetical protein